MKDIKIFSEDMQELLLKKLSQNQMDAKLFSLYLAKRMASCQVFPVLVDLLGEKSFLSLLMVMAGKQLYFPSSGTLLEAKIALDIYNEVNKIEKKNKPGRGKLIDKLAKKYKCNARKLYRRMWNIINT